MNLKIKANKCTTATILVGGVGSTIQIMDWFVPALTSHHIQGTNLSALLIPILLHASATTIMVAGALEITQLCGRPTAMSKIELACGAAMSIVAGLTHFIIAFDSASPNWLMHVSNSLAILGALAALISIAQLGEDAHRDIALTGS